MVFNSVLIRGVGDRVHSFIGYTSLPKAVFMILMIATPFRIVQVTAQAGSPYGGIFKDEGFKHKHDKPLYYRGRVLVSTTFRPTMP